MKVKIFNDTKTVELNDALVKTYTEATGVPVDAKGVEYALACDDIKADTELNEAALSDKVTKSLQMDIDVAKDVAEGKVGPA